MHRSVNFIFVSATTPIRRPGLSSISVARTTDPGELRGEMLYLIFGSAGERLSAIGFGGFHADKPAVLLQSLSV